MIYVVGDSHAWKFRDNPNFDVRAHAGVTAHGFSSVERSGSPVFDEAMLGISAGSRQEFETLVLPIVTDDDMVLFCMGEVDCRVHFYLHHIRQGVPIPELIANTVAKYGEFLLTVPCKFAVLEAPPAGEQENVYAFEHYATQLLRANIAFEFNRQLREFCEAHGMTFVSVWSEIADEKGCLKEEYAEPDGAHVSRNTVPFIERQLGCE